MANDAIGEIVTLGILGAIGYFVYQAWSSGQIQIPGLPGTVPSTTPVTSGGTAQGVTQSSGVQQIVTPALMSAVYFNGSINVTGPAGASVIVAGISYDIGSNGTLSIPVPPLPSGTPINVDLDGQLFVVTT